LTVGQCRDLAEAVLRTTVDWAASLFEVAGTFAMAFGALIAAVRAFRDRGSGGRAAFKGFRNRLGHAIILGLEFLVAADILRTISTEPSLSQVAVLGGIVLIRTFLSFSLEIELEGRLPWQAQALDREAHEAQPDRAPGGVAP
jgi:uncharacterized membrane protein